RRARGTARPATRNPYPRTHPRRHPPGRLSCPRTRGTEKRRARQVSASHSGSVSVEHALRQVTPGRYDAYEALLRALATPSAGQIWMLLWHGHAGSPDAQYGNMEVDGFHYAPCVTSAQELSASGWNRSYEVVDGLDVARTLYP